ncbi:MAG: GerMN domain-containing protein [Jatrophihabitans sp.]
MSRVRAGRPARRVWWAALALALLTGCTGIPSSSAPQVIRSVDRGEDIQGAPFNTAPEPGEPPRDIVSDFLTASAKQVDAGHSAARQFLTSQASRKWQDSTTTVVQETAVGVAVVTGGTATVRVTGRRVGQLDAAGVFTPILTGSGVGDEESFSYRLLQTAGQWRIDQLQPGVLIEQSVFSAIYLPRKLYFFDATEHTLVPDLRYSPLTGQQLASWLLTQLLAGPRPELGQSVVNEVPDQVGKPSVQLDDPVVVEMPGTAQLDGNGRNRLAAQLAYTLSQARFGEAQLRLTDSGRTVPIPAASGPTFALRDFGAYGPDEVFTGVQPFFLRGGALISGDDGKPVAGYLGQPARNLSSVALRHGGDGSLQVAAVSAGQLELGTDAVLSPVALPVGGLSRPEWRPHAMPAEAWIGVGNDDAIYRVVPGQPPRAVSISSPLGGLPPGRVIALRFSSDGVRLAAVLQLPTGVTTAWVGSVVTSGTDVRIDSFEPVTPALLNVRDVGWADRSKLLLIAGTPSTELQVWQVQSDGSQLTSLVNVGLPGGERTAIAVAEGRLPLLAVSDSIWTQRGSSWVSFPGGTPTPGINPIYSQ